MLRRRGGSPHLWARCIGPRKVCSMGRRRLWLPFPCPECEEDFRRRQRTMQAEHARAAAEAKYNTRQASRKQGEPTEFTEMTEWPRGTYTQEGNPVGSVQGSSVREHGTQVSGESQGRGHQGTERPVKKSKYHPEPLRLRKAGPGAPKGTQPVAASSQKGPREAESPLQRNLLRALTKPLPPSPGSNPGLLHHINPRRASASDEHPVGHQLRKGV
ncbi:unnamed protein product [Parascedosporium putredinis]|uniref:Uncharacterized protein n=1 Tax=Parascedosporium putredinis TaxID=1442378 RepID=A0A9P1H5F6_9PEZI|nr:unnamed protein product [Parascedosporium putredinis]CAI7997723.1 unnamed protein product [Parascedosporium putredinis]